MAVHLLEAVERHSADRVGVSVQCVPAFEPLDGKLLSTGCRCWDWPLRVAGNLASVGGMTDLCPRYSRAWPCLQRLVSRWSPPGLWVPVLPAVLDR